MPLGLGALLLVALLLTDVAHAQGTAGDPPDAKVDSPDGTQLTAQEEAMLSDSDLGLGLTDDYADDSPSLSLYGFTDFTYLQLLMPDSSPYYVVLEEHGTFFIGNFNLYLDGRLAERWRTLAEVRFLYLPNGVASDVTPDEQARTSTAVGDYADVNRPLRWGGIEIERVWLDFEAHRYLTIRGGQYLTPYGIWNVDHGSPVYIGTRRPYIVGQQLFPERQTGLMLHGEVPFGSTSIGYRLTLSNGRGPSDEFRDLDDNKAVGGRAFVSLIGNARLTFGASAYHGRFTDKSTDFALLSRSEVERTTTIAEQFDETALGADARLEWDGLLVQSEVVHRQRAFTRQGRPESANVLTGTPGLAPDDIQWGAYVLGGYRIAAIDLMPYAYYEFIDFGGGLIPNIATVQAGLNYRPTPPVVLKTQFSYAVSPGAEGLFQDEAITAIETQVAWAF